MKKNFCSKLLLMQRAPSYHSKNKGCSVLRGSVSRREQNQKYRQHKLPARMELEAPVGPAKQHFQAHQARRPPTPITDLEKWFNSKIVNGQTRDLPTQ
jgi:serine/threonine protein kinase HipA of HipAB toxin-antitoxin module